MPNTPNLQNALNLPHIPSTPNASILPNIPNIQNIPNGLNLPHRPNTPMIPNFPNIPNQQNISVMPNISNVPNPPNIPIRANASNLATGQNHSTGVVVPMHSEMAESSNPQNVPEIRPAENKHSALDKKCSSCSLEKNNTSLTLSCGCSIHINCVKINFEKQLIQAKSKIKNFNCKQCNIPIQFEFFDIVPGLDATAKRNANLLMFSYCKFICPADEKELKFGMLSKKFKARNKKCEFCNYNYCSFCHVKGGHRFNCDLLKAYKKGNLDEKKFITK